MPTSDVETISGQGKSRQINLIGYKMHCGLIFLQRSCTCIPGQKSKRIRYLWSAPSVLRFQHASCNDLMSNEFVLTSASNSFVHLRMYTNKISSRYFPLSSFFLKGDVSFWFCAQGYCFVW